MRSTFQCASSTSDDQELHDTDYVNAPANLSFVMVERYPPRALLEELGDSFQRCVHYCTRWTLWIWESARTGIFRYYNDDGVRMQMSDLAAMMPTLIAKKHFTVEMAIECGFNPA